MDPAIQTSPTSVNDLMEGGTASAIRIDQAKAEAFGSRMLTLLNHGALTLMISLGHKTRLFEVMATLPATTSAELSKAANLHERYVREWLATMYVGGIVVLDESSNPALHHHHHHHHAAQHHHHHHHMQQSQQAQTPKPQQQQQTIITSSIVRSTMTSATTPGGGRGGGGGPTGQVNSHAPPTSTSTVSSSNGTMGTASAAAGGKHGPGGVGYGMGLFAADTRFVLPPENAAFLTWGRGPENVAVLSQYISILSSFEARVEDCFRHGRGIGHTEYGDLKAIMAADAAQTIASSLVDWILPLGPSSLIQDLRAGVDVLDVQCGTGINLVTMAKEFPQSWFTGYDDNAMNIALAKDAAAKDKLRNVRFKCLRVTNAMETSAYDLVTCFGSLVDTGEIGNVVLRIYHALRPAGTFLLQDVAASSHTRDNKNHPAGPLLYAISVMYSIPAALDKTGSEEDAVGVMWGNDRALGVIRNAGFKCDKPRYLPEDHCNAFFFCFKD